MRFKEKDLFLLPGPRRSALRMLRQADDGPRGRTDYMTSIRICKQKYAAAFFIDGLFRIAL
jgi:hypothetical protein